MSISEYTSEEQAELLLPLARLSSRNLCNFACISLSNNLSLSNLPFLCLLFLLSPEIIFSKLIVLTIPFLGYWFLITCISRRLSRGDPTHLRSTFNLISLFF
ncbi:hypothetical protein GDO78_002672 [Eleutherodactylus coqui]|uniref:Uncharacterized protein n=1 Tax=Eleutherodactylus coqui TaxID=57060 RepID=A0A8J6EXA3_ELECQ|nr:hypothetical protein GDO78_002672 [Eleutherodactylus coqui]